MMVVCISMYLTGRKLLLPDVTDAGHTGSALAVLTKNNTAAAGCSEWQGD